MKMPIYMLMIYYVNRKEYVDWAVKVLTVVRSVWSTFSGEGESEWREFVHKEFIKAGITPEIIANKLENVKKFYPDSSELSITESKNNLYKKLCDDIYEAVSQGKKIDMKSWISDNVKNISD